MKKSPSQAFNLPINMSIPPKTAKIMIIKLEGYFELLYNI